MQDAATSYPGQQCGAFVAGLETLLYSRTLQCGSFCAPWHGQLAGVQTSPATVVLGATCSSTGLAYARTACTPSSERTLLPAPPPAPARIDSNRRRWSTVRRGTNEGRGSKEAGKVPCPAAQSRDGSALFPSNAPWRAARCRMPPPPSPPPPPPPPPPPIARDGIGRTSSGRSS